MPVKPLHAARAALYQNNIQCLKKSTPCYIVIYPPHISVNKIHLIPLTLLICLLHVSIFTNVIFPNRHMRPSIWSLPVRNVKPCISSYAHVDIRGMGDFGILHIMWTSEECFFWHTSLHVDIRGMGDFGILHIMWTSEEWVFWHTSYHVDIRGTGDFGILHIMWTSEEWGFLAYFISCGHQRNGGFWHT